MVCYHHLLVFLIVTIFLQTLENLNISNSVIVSKNSEFIKADKKNNSWDIQVKQHNEFFNINSKYIY